MDERQKGLLIKQNPWWSGKEIELPEFKRDLFGELKKYAQYKQIIALVGLRRIGKTVLLKQIIQELDAPKNNICYISFDDIDFQKYEIANEIINYFLEFSDKTKERYLFLDEIQKLPNWADLLKVIYDTEERLKIFVSGSASLELKEYKETLAGRILTFHLPVFTFKEFARFFGMEHKISFENIFRDYDLKFLSNKERYEELFEKYLLNGAFPEIIQINDEEFIKKYIKESVIEKAIFDAARISRGNEKNIFDLFKMLANSNSQLFELVNLSKNIGINRNLVCDYVNLLEKSFLIKINYNFTTSVAKQVRASKKQYLAHSSIVIACLDYPFEIIRTEVVGRLVEGVIANNIENSSFWRTPQKEEIDIVKNEGKIPIEIKYQSQIVPNDLKFVITHL